MIKGQTSKRNGIQDFLCPFTDMYITQGANGGYSHKGTMANDIRGLQAGVKYPYYAPCDVKVIATYPSSGQVMWQSKEKVRFANGRIDYATFMTVHDDTMNVSKGFETTQGSQIGNMGTKGYATGVHCHIQISQSNDTSWYKNANGIYQFNNEYDTDDCYFVDNTNIMQTASGNWKYLKDVPVVIPTPTPTEADQVLTVGSKVKFNGVFSVDIVRTGTNMFGCTKLTGISFNDYKNLKAQEYHWIPANDFTEVDASGNVTKDQMLGGGLSYVKNDNTYTVKSIDIPTQSVELTISGKSVWVYSSCLYEL